MSKKRILVVDDEPDIIDIIRSRLEETNYQVISADNGEQALWIAQTARPHLILLDIYMTGINGFEVLRQLMLDRETRNIPVVMLTGDGSTQSLLKAQKLNATDYIMKPFKLDELMSHVKKYAL
ncbi:MAG: response regulator [Candidatus Omnitrophica bacterium]|nr:response regulator [Candidatus Omnitrophota bacterium]